MVLQLRLSGGAGNTNPNASLGGVMSTTSIVDAVDNNLFDDISRKEVIVGKTEYRCYYVFNSSGSTPVHGAFLFIDDFPDISTVTMGLDPVGSGDGVATGVAQTIALEDTTPTGVTFENAGEFIVKVPLPTLRSLEGQAIWVKRVANEGKAAIETLGLTITGNEEALTPANLTINDNTVANPTLVTTTANHNLVTGNAVTITGSNSTPTIDGVHTITLIDADTFSIPVNVTIAGTAGTVAVGGDFGQTEDGLNLAGERTIFNLSALPFKIGVARVGFSQIE